MSTRNRLQTPDTTSPSITGDVRDLLGMNTRAASLVAGLFLVSLIAQLVVSVGNGSALLPGITVLVLVALSAVGLLTIPDDPLPVRFVVAVLACVPIGVYVSFIGTPLPPTGPEQTWQFGAITAVATYMCVRGRAGSAWLLQCLVVCATVLWTQLYGDGATQGLALSAATFGPLFMATLFAVTIRPAAASIYQLRKRAVERNAAQVASLAAVAEHDKQMRALNHRVRPMLERITDPTPLTDSERAECLALEAQLRDALRAPILAGHECTAQAAARARGRGVTVVMVDGHGLDDTAAADREYVLGRLACALDTVTGGSIIIRVLPPGRDLVATAVIDPDAGGTESASHATRLEFALP
ncbi:hypothetical protein [uncultured Gordonia sp.]|uniref:hypothetical protein n=1 Tax=uncultured Gordonia sp. TaxID=198437 RepID=UPI0026108697|nr:hypothetical protein [uncultured Gordonia sp.]